VREIKKARALFLLPPSSPPSPSGRRCKSLLRHPPQGEGVNETVVLFDISVSSLIFSNYTGFALLIHVLFGLTVISLWARTPGWRRSEGSGEGQRASCNTLTESEGTS